MEVNWRSARVGLAAGALLAISAGALAAYVWADPQPIIQVEAEAAANEQLARRLKAACASAATYDRLKQVAFDEAIRMRSADPANLDLLSTYSLVRVENPVVESRDETLDVTVCSGRFVLELPPGAEAAFGGEKRLVADIEYAAQAAADGSGLVYQIDGAEPIISRLAAFDLNAPQFAQGALPPERPAAPRPGPVVVASAEPLAIPPERPAPSAEPIEPAPAPRVTRAASPPAPPRPEARERQASQTAPSFNCRYGRSRSERMVCSSEQLAALDREMSSRFYSALDRSEARVRDELRRSRDRFLAYRDRCDSEACVAQAYRDRMDEIEDITAAR